MSDLGQLLAAIRFGDSAFPCGGFAFSSGLEGSHRDGLVGDEDDLTAFVAEALHCRWHCGDRVLMRHGWARHDVTETDLLAEALATSSVLREASRRAGAATLGTFVALVDGGVVAYRRRVLAGTVPGHLPVAQALCFRAAGLTLEVAETVAAWQMLAGITGAAVRLGVIGHLGAQRVTSASTPLLLDLLRREPRDQPATFTAYAEIAAQRRGDGTRLFAS